MGKKLLIVTLVLFNYFGWAQLPTANASQTFCTGATVSNLAATGTALKWYNVATGGTALASTTVLTTGTYYVEQQTTPESTVTLASGFNKPFAVVVEVDGKILVADTFHNEIKRMNADGSGVITLGSGFNHPLGISVQADGKILVADTYNYSIKRMNADGTGVITLSSGFTTPTGVAIQADGKILVSDTGTDSVIRMNNDGSGIVILGSGFNSPNGIAVQSDGKILVSDTYNNVVKRMNTDGTGIVTVGSGFNHPRGISIQSDGKIVVVDEGNNAIKRMNTDGTGTVSLGSGFDSPMGVTIQADGAILVADFFNFAIKKIIPPVVSGRVTVNVTVNVITAPTGLNTQVYTGLATLANLTAIGNQIKWYDAATTGSLLPTNTLLVDGAVYYASQTKLSCESINRLPVTVRKISPVTQTFCSSATTSDLISTPSTTANWYSDAAGEIDLSPSTVLSTATYYVGQTFPENIITLGSGFSDPTAVVMQDDGAILVADDGHNAIKRMNSEGNGIVTLASGFSSIRGVAVQLDGKILVTSTGDGSIKRMNADGTNNIILASGFSQPRGVAVQIDGKILVVDGGSNSVKSMNADGSGIAILSTGFNIPYGIAVQNDGKVLVTDIGTGSVKRMNVDGTNIVTLVSGLSSPTGVAIQPNGKILVSDYTDIKRMNADGTNIEILGSGSSYPRGVAVQSDGSIIVADYSNSAVKRITPAGVSNLAPVSVTVSSIVTPKFTAVAPICSGGTLEALPTTSNNGILGSWSPALNNLTTTSYLFTPTVGQCATTTTMIITVYPIVTPTFTAVAPICKGEILEALPTTSNNGILGNWLPALNNLTTTTYTFTPTLEQCNPSATMTIIVNPIITPTFTAVAPICSGGILDTLPTTSNNDVLGTWSPALNNLATTTYTFTPSRGQCATTATLAISIITTRLPTASAQTFCNSGTVAGLTATGTDLKWYANATGGSALFTTNLLATGTYYVSQTLNSCESSRTAVMVTITTAPSITYNTPNTYSIGTSISPLAPTNSCGIVPATIYGVSTFAGTGFIGSTDGSTETATFTGPTGVAIDVFGNVFVADKGNHIIRKITAAGVVTTFAGSGTQGATDGPASTATFNQPYGIAVDTFGNLYVADYSNNKVRKITPTGIVSTLAGSGLYGSVDGTATVAAFRGPTGVAVDASGNVYVTDLHNFKIRKITVAGVVSTLAGNGTNASVDGPVATASFSQPQGITVDVSGNVYVADGVGYKIRKISSGGVVSTLAGNGTYGSIDGPAATASFQTPVGVVVDVLGNVYVANIHGNNIRKITPLGLVSTLTGGVASWVDGSLAIARFSKPYGLALDSSGNIYVAEEQNHRIRKITLTGYEISPNLPAGLSFDPTTGIISGTPTATSVATDYIVTAHTMGGSSSSTVNISVGTLSTDSFEVKNNLKIYPNPTASNVTIELNNLNNANLQVSDINGRILLTQKLNSTNSIDMSNLPTATYLFKINSDEGTATSKVIKK